MKKWHCAFLATETLQDLNENDMATIQGPEQIHIWRRSYDVQPPPLAVTDSRTGKSRSYYHVI
jgi:2,3-bisphosphoglycerate-dependent phosphoglycerate mutase